MWKLVIEDDEGKRTVVALTRDEYTIGRKEGNSIRLTERNVSRDHAKLTRKQGASNGASSFALGDMTSYNGVYVNGLRVADNQDLAHGDLIQIGDYRIVLQDEAVAVPAPEEAAAIPIDPEDLKATVNNPPPVPSPLRATNATFLEKPNRLVVLAGPNPGEEFPLVGDRLTIGRAEDATVSINHNSVSRLHCEVHSLGEGRFEIVDKGSSNGVRVNGADLRRGIIEAGDVIELGDVKFKFVGEGQIFRPGTGESQQLATISQRSATSVVRVRPDGKSSLIPAVVIGVILALGAIGLYVVNGKSSHTDTGPGPDPNASTKPEDTTGADAAMLADARRMADIGDVEGAHKKASQLPPGSPLVTSADFQLIEFKWAAALMAQANGETDPAAKAAILQRLVGDTYADPSTKKTAAEQLAALDAAAGKDAGKHGPVASAAPHQGPITVTPVVQHTTTVAPPPENPTPRPPPRPSGPSLTELASSANPADWQKARNILEGRVFGKHGTDDDARMLKSICKAQHDQQCVAQIKSLYPGI
jgi:ABC transport system ATP-binding/permease protein